MEQTLILVKPDARYKTEEILEIFEKNGLKFDNIKELCMTEELINEHYAHLIDKPFFPKLRDYMMSDIITAGIISGENAVTRVRTIVGATDPQKAEKGTIRNIYGTNITYNAIHASDSVENAQIEIERFFKPKKTLQKTLVY